MKGSLAVSNRRYLSLPEAKGNVLEQYGEATDSEEGWRNKPGNYQEFHLGGEKGTTTGRVYMKYRAV